MLDSRSIKSHHLLGDTHVRFLRVMRRYEFTKIYCQHKMTNVQLLCSTYRLANSGIRVAQALVFCVVVSGAIFLLLSMSLCCLSRFTASDFPLSMFT